MKEINQGISEQIDVYHSLSPDNPERDEIKSWVQEMAQINRDCLIELLKKPNPTTNWLRRNT